MNKEGSMTWTRRTTTAAVLAAAVLLVGTTCQAAFGQPVQQDEPTLERCLVSLVDEAKVPAEEPGVLVQLLVARGDVVGKGQVIARIDDDQPQMEKRKAQAEHDQAVAKSKSDVDVRFAVASEEVAQTELDKALDANRRSEKAIPEVEINRLRLNQKKSELQIEQAKLELSLAALAAVSKGVEVEASQNGIERRLIRSPLDGIVEDVAKHEGEWMQPGDMLAHVLRTDKLRVEGYVDAARWDPEDVRDRPVTVEVRLANDRREQFQGRIVFVSSLVESGGDYRVFAEVENRQTPASKQWLLRAGQTARMTIHSKQQPLPPARLTAPQPQRSAPQ
jgi:macrolide-specific efflux system membrane fusion protein